MRMVHLGGVLGQGELYGVGYMLVYGQVRASSSPELFVALSVCCRTSYGANLSIQQHE